MRCDSHLDRFVLVTQNGQSYRHDVDIQYKTCLFRFLNEKLFHLHIAFVMMWECLHHIRSIVTGFKTKKMWCDLSLSLSLTAACLGNQVNKSLNIFDIGLLIMSSEHSFSFLIDAVFLTNARTIKHLNNENMLLLNDHRRPCHCKHVQHISIIARSVNIWDIEKSIVDDRLSSVQFRFSRRTDTMVSKIIFGLFGKNVNGRLTSSRKIVFESF